MKPIYQWQNSKLRRQLALTEFEEAIKIHRLYRRGPCWYLHFNSYLLKLNSGELIDGPASAAFQKAAKAQTGRPFPHLACSIWRSELAKLFPPVIYNE